MFVFLSNYMASSETEVHWDLLCCNIPENLNLQGIKFHSHCFGNLTRLASTFYNKDTPSLHTFTRCKANYVAVNVFSDSKPC